MRTRGGLQNGVFGAAVVGLVLFATLGVAFLANGDEREIDTTNWNYVTNANPAFDYDQAPGRVDYSPPANYTGYTTNSTQSEYISGVTYTTTPTPTAYLAKNEPVLITSGDISYSSLHSNGLSYIGNAGDNWLENLLHVGSDYYTPASVATLTNLSTALAAATSSEFDDKTIITLTSSSDNLFFAQSKYDGGGTWAGAAIAHIFEYDINGPMCDRVEINFNTQIAKLYDGTALKHTIPVTNALLIVADVDGSITTAAQLEALTVSYSAASVDIGYINPNYGVTIDSTVIELSDFASAPHVSYDQDTTVYNSVNFSGYDILDYAFYLGGDEAVSVGVYMTVAQGTTINISYGWHTIYEDTGLYISPYTFTANTLGEAVHIHYMRDDESGGEFWQYEIHLYVRTVAAPAVPGTVNWFNGYKNAAADILVKSFDGSIDINGLSVVCDSSSWTVGGVSVGTWPAVIVTFDMDAGVSVTPVASMINFMSYQIGGSPVQINTTTTAPIEKLTFSRDYDVNLAVISTVVYLEGGGLYRVDSSLNVGDKFPTYDTYNLTISGASHWGDGLTINGVLYSVDKYNGTVIIDGVSFPLAGLALTYSDNEYYYNGAVYEAGHVAAISGDYVKDLGEADGVTVVFNGTWYYETQLYEGAPGTITVTDWSPGILTIDAPAVAAMFTLLAIIGAALASRMGAGTWDYLILGSAIIIGFIMCGVLM